MNPWQSVPPTGRATTDPMVVHLALGPDPGTTVRVSRQGGRLFAHYSRTRVHIDRDAWEMLQQPDDVLVERIRRPGGSFSIALTRAELESVFGAVRDTAAWDEERCYHFPVDPPATSSFLVTIDGEPVVPLEDDPAPERRTRTPRAAMGAQLRALWDEFGTAPIPATVLLERELAPSAARHPAYWSLSNAGGKAAADVGLAGTLRLGRRGMELHLREAASRSDDAREVGGMTKARRVAALSARLQTPLSDKGQEHMAFWVRSDVLTVLERSVGSHGPPVSGSLRAKATALVQRLDLGDVPAEVAVQKLANTTIEVLDKLLASVPLAAAAGAPAAVVTGPGPAARAPATPPPTQGPSPRPVVADAWTALPDGPMKAWLSGLAHDGHRRVLAHIALHGSIAESEVAEMLSSPREGRHFARSLDDLVPPTAPLRVRVDNIAGIKRYVREDG